MYHPKIFILTLGDGISSGETAYEVKGYSFNDYLKDYIEDNSIIGEYITEFTSKEETTETFKMKLDNNYTLESTNTQIQQTISKATILTIALGMNELNSKKELKSKDIENYLNNMNKILKILRIYNDKEMFLISLYPTKKLSLEKVQQINKELKIMCDNNSIKFVDIENIYKTKDYFFNNDSYYLNYKGHRFISEKIIENLD